MGKGSPESEFSRAADKVLTRRVANAPAGRNEKRGLQDGEIGFEPTPNSNGSLLHSSGDEKHDDRADDRQDQAGWMKRGTFGRSRK